MSNEITTNQASSPEEEVKELSKEEKIDIFTNWIKDLRSGDFKQTTEHIKVENCNGTFYCCLGVLEYRNKDRFNLDEKLDSTRMKLDEYGEDTDEIEESYFAIGDSADLLDLKFSIKIGFGRHLDFSSSKGYLAKLNDEGKTFLEIADIIEEEILKPLLKTQDE